MKIEVPDDMVWLIANMKENTRLRIKAEIVKEEDKYKLSASIEKESTRC